MGFVTTTITTNLALFALGSTFNGSIWPLHSGNQHASSPTST